MVGLVNRDACINKSKPTKDLSKTGDKNASLANCTTSIAASALARLRSNVEKSSRKKSQINKVDSKHPMDCKDNGNSKCEWSIAGSVKTEPIFCKPKMGGTDSEYVWLWAEVNSSRWRRSGTETEKSAQLKDCKNRARPR